MSSLAEEKTFETRLFDDDDENEDLVYKNLLQALITQSKSASDVAAEIDTWISQDAHEKYNALKSRSPPFHLEEGEETWSSMLVLGPNPSKYISSLFFTIAAVCSAFPPAHPAQNRLVELIQALKDLPRHDVPSFLPPDDDDKYNFDEAMTLWEFGTDNVRWLMMKFNSEVEEFSYPFSDIESPGSEVQLRWRNLQAFIARVTTSNLIDCGDLCALRDILPSSPFYPNLEERKIGGPKRIEGDLVAGSYWLSSDQARQWVYEQCKNALQTEHKYYVLWSLDTWSSLKNQLGFIASDARFSGSSRQLAASLQEKMIVQESASA